jgi:hypothetical protein
MIAAIRRFIYRQRFLRDFERSLARRALVEDELLKMSRGRLPLPDAAKCRELAQRLGVPENWRSR